MDYEKAIQQAKDNNDTGYVAFLEKEAGVGPSSTAKQNPEKRQKTRFLIEVIEARQKAHLTQAALAEKVGMSQSSLARIESGQGNPTLSTLLKLAAALDVKIVLQGRS